MNYIQNLIDMSNKIKCASITKVLGGKFLDKNNILWCWVDGVFIGKRSVQTTCLKHIWIDNITSEIIKSYPCAKDSDYNEIFTLKKV